MRWYNWSLVVESRFSSARGCAVSIIRAANAGTTRQIKVLRGLLEILAEEIAASRRPRSACASQIGRFSMGEFCFVRVLTWWVYRKAFSWTVHRNARRCAGCVAEHHVCLSKNLTQVCVISSMHAVLSCRPTRCTPAQVRSQQQRRKREQSALSGKPWQGCTLAKEACIWRHTKLLLCKPRGSEHCVRSEKPSISHHEAAFLGVAAATNIRRNVTTKAPHAYSMAARRAKVVALAAAVRKKYMLDLPSAPESVATANVASPMSKFVVENTHLPSKCALTKFRARWQPTLIERCRCAVAYRFLPVYCTSMVKTGIKIVWFKVESKAFFALCHNLL